VRNERKNTAGSAPRSSTSTSAEPTMTPSAHAEAGAHGQSRYGLDGREVVGGFGGQRRLTARDAGARDGVHEALACGTEPL
jgi:hypothetical protein